MTPVLRRAVLGGAAGFAVFAVDAIATLIRYVLNPAVAERATGSAALAMLVFLVLFVAGGALCGLLWALRAELPRHALIGAIAGALLWSYLRATWTLTARAGSPVETHAGVMETALIGALGGALAGGLLFAIAAVRRRIGRREGA